MLELAESILGELRRLRASTEAIVVSGAVRDMEQYKQLMGRLEGYVFVEDAIKDLLKRHNNL